MANRKIVVAQKLGGNAILQGRYFLILPAKYPDQQEKAF